ncbi:serine/threonine-protein kinase pim-2-like [Centroberyx affinis]|uniref:serine/threonine-protein kinase pim-2-like n=1 Tax=Centroberyx affinis TaxID=166261 RepID=UPI003A5BE032
MLSQSAKPVKSLPTFTSWTDIVNRAIAAETDRHTAPCNLPTDDDRKRRNKRKADSDESREENKKKKKRGTTSVDSGQTNSRAEFEAKYKELGPLGEGGFGSVHRGYRRNDDFPVAIKHIPREKVFRTTVIQNGKTCDLPLEVVLLMKVAAGPGSVGQTAAVALLDWYDLDQELILVLERPSPCMDLSDYLNASGGFLQEREAKILMRQLVDAFVEIHAKGVLHRDIKLENLLVETDGPRFRVIDFGCGCILTEGNYTTCWGTRLYIPPEWYEHQSYRAEPFTVWQLGVVLYIMVTGFFPFYVTSEILLCNPEISNQLSQHCQDLLRKCLAKCPDSRPTLEELQFHPWLQ